MNSDLEKLYDTFKKSNGVSTDTRQITRGSVFFALKGDRFNANEFAEEALAKGAACAVVDDASRVKDDRYILVKDTLVALQQLARHHRDQLTIPVIGLTGSNGKTTSKELVSAVLAKKFNVLATKGNLNNHIGVPLTILSIDSSVEIAVIEMGANRLGDIQLLCGIANPTHGFITNIGKAHIGTFGGFENIIRGKSELYQHLITHKGIVWINSQNPILANMAKRFEAPMFYPQRGDFYHCELTRVEPYLEVKTEEGHLIKTHLVGEYNFENIAIALTIGKFFDVNSLAAKEAIGSYVPGNMRSQIMLKGSNTIVLDAYNANPSSMEAAVKSLSKMKAQKRIAILGDMYELEEESEKEHRRLGELLAEYKIDKGLFCGKLIKAARRPGYGITFFDSKEELINYLKANPITNATVLVKASRGMAMESIVDYL